MEGWQICLYIYFYTLLADLTFYRELSEHIRVDKRTKLDIISTLS